MKNAQHRETSTVTDYVCGRVLFQHRRWLDREIERLRELGKDDSANMLNTVLSALDAEIGVQPLAVQHLQALTAEAAAPRETPPDRDPVAELAALFDPVTLSQLETMFPVEAGRWESWAERAKRNGLDHARTKRGLFNPYMAGMFFLKQGIPGWSLERVQRKLAANLPPRSQEGRPLLTGELD